MLGCQTDADSREHLNIVFIGHVDAGKSTLSGNILYLTDHVDRRTIEKYEREAKQRNRRPPTNPPALLPASLPSLPCPLLPALLGGSAPPTHGCAVFWPPATQASRGSWRSSWTLTKRSGLRARPSKWAVRTWQPRPRGR